MRLIIIIIIPDNSNVFKKIHTSIMPQYCLNTFQMSSCLKIGIHFSMYIFVILSITATNVCFNTSSLSVAEDQGVVVFALNLSHPSSFDITITITSSDITTNGEVTVTAY